MTKKNKILILSSYIGLVLIFLIFNKYHIPCLFKQLLNIPCPSCGMTRAFKAMISFNFKKALSYNILSIPLFIILIIIFITTLTDILFNKNNLKKLTTLIVKNYRIIIMLIIINWIINIYKDI